MTQGADLDMAVAAIGGILTSMRVAVFDTVWWKWTRQDIKSRRLSWRYFRQKWCWRGPLVPDPTQELDAVKRNGYLERALEISGARGQSGRLPRSVWTGYLIVLLSNSASRTCALWAAGWAKGRRYREGRQTGDGWVQGSGLAKEAKPSWKAWTRYSSLQAIEWRIPGCSLVLCDEPDRLESGEHCASHPTRNLEGASGNGGAHASGQPRPLRQRGDCRQFRFDVSWTCSIRGQPMTSYSRTILVCAGPWIVGQCGLPIRSFQQFLQVDRRSGFGKNLVRRVALPA